MRALNANHPHPDNDPESPLPSPESLRICRYKLIIGHCVAFAVPAILALAMVIFLAIPALMPPEFGLDLESSISSSNISTVQWNIFLSIKNPSKLIAVKYTHVKLLLSFGQLPLPHHLVIPSFTQGPSNVTTVPAMATVANINDLSAKGLVSALKDRRDVTINIEVKAKRRLHLGPWWVPMFDAYASCMDVTFMASTDSKGVGHWRILEGTLGCTIDILTLLW
ncbi:hypothetical protein ACJRO7_009657 [Eucalyptus globulus]|uniref:Late embryogenesis abundant protein LEA-2 subgroup domain-containing protein n=1 Tax=Eucalyptus globulus TaxID=34317 RepID=A0ABD3LED4_EUCGL